MSDPVTNVEIEDVLSSIRRLVSESGGVKPEVRKAAPIVQRTAPEPAQDAVVEDAGQETVALDKLVLTPSLRIADAPEADPAPEAEPDAEPEMEAAEEPSYEPEPEGSHTPESAEAHTPEAAPEDSEAPAEEAESHAEQSARAHSDEPEGDSLKDRIEQLEAAVSSQEGEWEEEEGEGEQALQWEDHSEEADAEEHMSAPEAYAEPHHEIDDVEEAEELTDGEEFDFLAGDETLIDEDALREMVADIVRQELQGALGERITRNVRKLVRREIHRALMAQEFE